MTHANFSTLKLKQGLLENLETLGYLAMTPIQAQSIPLILEGKDVIAQAKTGSGKTAAFGLGLLQNLVVKRFRVQTLVLCPTRELADQVAKEIRRLARGIHNIKVLTLCGGKPFGPQIGSLEHGAHIIVGTPGRVEEHLTKGSLNLDNLNTFVLDEADRMLEMGFQSALDAIVEFAPKDRQTLLFSATFPDQIALVANKIMKQPERVTAAEANSSETIKQHFYKVDDNEHRMVAVRLLLQKHRPKSAIIFCNTKIETQDVADELFGRGFSAMAIHGDLDQKDRDQVLVRFASKSISVLVATDVAARGLDIDTLNLVINYHLSRDSEVHVHRVGRTGRAGNSGMACSLYSEKESYKVSVIEQENNLTVKPEDLPSINYLDKPIDSAAMVCFQIDGGKKQKLRAGDILGALTSPGGITGDQVGKINLFDNRAYVAVEVGVANVAYEKLSEGKMKGRSFRVRWMR
ncbi:MAG: ATP-independent RNA helicase DbpA [Oleiphilaceae bacterium]